MAAESEQEKVNAASDAAETRRLADLARAMGLGGSPDAELELNQQAIDLLWASQKTPLLADVLRWQGSVLLQRGRAADAEPLYERSLAIAETIGYDGGCAYALNGLALIRQRRGDLNTALSLFNEAAAIADRCGDERLRGMIQQNLGILADIRGEPTRARIHYWWSLHVFERTSDTEGMIWVLNNLGLVDADEAAIEERRAEHGVPHGELDEAMRSVDRALAIEEQRRDASRQATALKVRAVCERRGGDARKAIDTLREALMLATANEDAKLRGEILFELGEAVAASSDERGAKDVWNTALEAFERIGAKAWITRVRARLGTVDSHRPS